MFSWLSKCVLMFHLPVIQSVMQYVYFCQNLHYSYNFQAMLAIPTVAKFSTYRLDKNLMFCISAPVFASFWFVMTIYACINLMQLIYCHQFVTNMQVKSILLSNTITFCVFFLNCNYKWIQEHIKHREFLQRCFLNNNNKFISDV